jgi:hypothetical protein
MPMVSKFTCPTLVPVVFGEDYCLDLDPWASMPPVAFAGLCLRPSCYMVFLVVKVLHSYPYIHHFCVFWVLFGQNKRIIFGNSP